MYKTYPINFLHLTAVMAQWLKRLHRKWDIRVLTLVDRRKSLNKDSDSSTAKCLATGVSVKGPRRS